MEEFAGNNRPNPWRWLIDPRSNHEIEDEIREELQFHFDQMIEAERQNGIGEADAEQIVIGKFGSIKRYVSECKQIQTWDRIMLQRIQVGLVSVLIVLLAMSYLDSRNLASQLSSIETQLQAFKEQTSTPAKAALSKVDDPDWMEIFVCDEAGKPITGAEVQVEWATTDRDRYESYTRKTNSQGLLHVLRDESVILQYLQAHSKGTNWVRRTLTQSRQDYLEQHKLVLEDAVPITIQLLDVASDLPLANAQISNPYQRFRYQPMETDNEGRISLDWFSKGATATISGTVYIETEAKERSSNFQTVHTINGKPHLSYTFSQDFEVDKAVDNQDFQLKVKLNYNNGNFVGGGGAF